MPNGILKIPNFCHMNSQPLPKHQLMMKVLKFSFEKNRWMRKKYSNFKGEMFDKITFSESAFVFNKSKSLLEQSFINSFDCPYLSYIFSIIEKLRGWLITVFYYNVICTLFNWISSFISFNTTDRQALFFILVILLMSQNVLLTFDIQCKH